MSDIADLAEAREAELRADALNALQRKMRDAATRASATHCEECGTDIPLERQQAVPGVQLCVHCQEVIERTMAGKTR